MLIGYIPGYHVVAGKSQGYQGLPLKGVMEETPYGPCHAMQSLWHPSPEDLRNLLAGGGVVLTVLGTSHPPVRVECVGPEAFGLDRAPSPATGTSEKAEMAEGQSNAVQDR